MDGRLSSFHFLTMMDNAAIHTSFIIDFWKKTDPYKAALNNYPTLWICLPSSLWFPLTCSSLLCISYELGVGLKELMRFRLMFLAGELHGWSCVYLVLLYSRRGWLWDSPTLSDASFDPLVKGAMLGLSIASSPIIKASAVIHGMIFWYPVNVRFTVLFEPALAVSLEFATLWCLNSFDIYWLTFFCKEELSSTGDQLEFLLWRRDKCIFLSFNYQFPEDRVGVITALITGWEGRRQVGRTLCSRRQGSHRLLPDPLISYMGMLIF